MTRLYDDSPTGASATPTRYSPLVSTAEQTSPADRGVLATLRDLLPPDWQDRLAELFELDPSQVAWLGDESARIGAHLLLFLERGWPEMLAVATRVIGFALASAFLTGAAVALLGWVLYLLVVGPLLRRGWGSGRLVGCLIATGVALSAGAGGGWAGLWLGGGWALERAIEQEYVVERVAAATFLAFTLEEEDLPASVDTAEVEGLLERAQILSGDSWAEFRARAEVAVAEAGLEQQDWLRADLMAGVVEQLSGEGAPDLVALHRIVSSPTVPDGFDRLPQTAGIRKRAVGFVRANVYSQAATGLGIGLGVPVIGLTLFGLLGCLVNRGTPTSSREVGANSE